MQNTDQLADEVLEKGFAVVSKVVNDSQISQLISTIEKIRQRDRDNCSAGVRHLLKRSSVVRKFASSPELMEIAAKIVGDEAKPVKAILFDKSAEANWYVTWHQDVTIAVKKKIELNGFGPWSVKDGIQHVQPPAHVLDKIVSLRIHLDDCPTENGAIKFIAGSHKAGIMDSAEIAMQRDNQQHICCPADRGDIIVMRPLILHSSSQSTKIDHRRILHIEFVGAELPGGLVWAESSGLDSVELIMATEEEFGIEIPNQIAEKITTVGEMYEYLKSELKAKSAEDCITQRYFYKLRKALIQNFGVSRIKIKVDSKVSDLISKEELEEGWPYLQVFMDLKTADYKIPTSCLWVKMEDRTLTVRDLVMSMISLNSGKIAFTKNTEEAIWETLLDVICRQLNVNRNEVTYSASFTRDLGVC